MKATALILILAIPAYSQVYTPPPNQPAPRNNNPPSDTVVRSNNNNNNANQPIYGNEVPFFDPSQDTISWNGNTWAASDNRLLEARFEKYLNEPEESSDAAKEYRETIDEILELLSPVSRRGAKKKPDFARAVELLPRASIYPGDAKLCDSLMNALYTAVLAQRDVHKTKSMMTAMEKEKDRVIKNGDLLARGHKLGERRQVGGGAGTIKNDEKEVDDGTGIKSLRYKDYLRRITEIEAMKKTHQLKTEVKTELAKMQYQALMVQFFMQRRFKHVVMASRFYNQIWKDGDGTLYLDEKSDIDKLFTESVGVSPTVSTLDSLANEAMRDVNKGVEAFLFLSERGELESASKRLMESYLVGEFMPSINTLPREKKRRVLAFVRHAYVLSNAINSKDYTRAKEIVDEMKKTSNDFDSTKAEAAIATFTRVSNMHIDAAKLAASKGDTEKASEEIKKAMEVWPQNPKLAEFDKLVESSGSMARLVEDFDRLFAEQNYREVYKRQYEFPPAIQGDAAREEKFRTVIKNIGEIDGTVVGAKEYVNNGLLYAAWEKLATVHEKFPDDPVLNQEMTKLAPQVADFTMALKKAKDFENEGQIGSALGWFYKAKHLHAGSTTADSGIKRMLDKVIPESTTTTAPAEDEVPAL